MKVRTPTFDITPHDIDVWELQLAREGTLPPDVQHRMLAHITDRVVLAPHPTQRVKYERAQG